jgi:hypothetical protein
MNTPVMYSNRLAHGGPKSHARESRSSPHQQGRMFRVPEFMTRYIEEAAAIERRTPGAQLRVLLEEAVEMRERAKAAAISGHDWGR